jgi:3-hydroxymyristoyl/3-hydroxydecanoyl-(acyl carrier protein) dehydratase
VSEAAHATLCLPADHPIFAGHFSGMPLVPGVMLLDWVLREQATVLGVEPHALRIRETKFFSPLRPEECAELFLTPGAGRHVFQIHRAGQVLASGVLELK